MSTTCEHIMNNGQCLPLNAFNIGPTCGSVLCQSVGCEVMCPVRRIYNGHIVRLAQRLKSSENPIEDLNITATVVTETGRALQELPNLAGIRALGARFVH